MAGHSRSKNGVASLAYVPAIHAFFVVKAWMPGMTRERFACDPHTRYFSTAFSSHTTPVPGRSAMTA
jgi:hypothetical protein